MLIMTAFGRKADNAFAPAVVGLAVRLSPAQSTNWHHPGHQMPPRLGHPHPSRERMTDGSLFAFKTPFTC